MGIDVEQLKMRLGNSDMVREIVYIEETTSTNILAKQLGRSGAPDGTLVVTDYQTQGRGRLGRSWRAPLGKDIFMSLLLRPKIVTLQASMLSLVMGLSVSEAIEEVVDEFCEIKWPNDVVVGGKKVCGILTEMQGQKEQVDYVVIGVGINCNTQTFPPEFSDHATSLTLAKGGAVLREGVIARVLRRFAHNYKKFLYAGDLSLLLGAYEKRMVNMDREIRVVEKKQEILGIARGITSKGELLVDTKDGIQQRIVSGEVSVRGLYGYV